MVDATRPAIIAMYLYWFLKNPLNLAESVAQYLSCAPSQYYVAASHASEVLQSKHRLVKCQDKGPFDLVLPKSMSVKSDH